MLDDIYQEDEDMSECHELDKVGSHFFSESFNEQKNQSEFKKEVPEFYLADSCGASRNVLVKKNDVIELALAAPINDNKNFSFSNRSIPLDEIIKSKHS